VTVAILLGVVALAAAPVDGGSAEREAGAAGEAGAGPAADAGAGPAAEGGPPAGADGGAAAIGQAPDARGPRVRLKGVVLSKGSRDPLAGATIIVDAQPLGETGSDGRFEIETAPGRRHVHVQFPGYEPSQLTVEASAEGEAVTVRLMPRLTGERYETVVAAPSTEAPRVSLQGEELTRTPGSMGEPFRVIESLPGVTQVAWPLALYAIRGANPGNTGFFLDGIRLPALFHFALGPEVIHPFFIEQMEFYPGGYPARYGRFVSGVVAASTATPKTDRVRGSVDARVFDAGGIVAAPYDEGRGAIAIAGRYSYTGMVFSLISPDYNLGYWDYQVRADHTLGSGKVTLFALGSHDLFGDRRLPDQDLKIDFHRLALRWEGKLGPGRLQAGVSGGLDQSRVSIEPLVKLPIRSSARSLSPRVYYLVPGTRADLEVGADAELQQFRPHSEREDAARQDVFQDRLAVAPGGYVSATWRPTGSLMVSPGLRYDHFFEAGVDKGELGPRLGVRYRPFGETWLKANVGRYAQMASLPVAVPGFDGFGLSTFGTQTSKQGSVGIEQALGDALSLDVTGFYQRLLLTDLESMFSYDPQDPRWLQLRPGESYGVEVMLRRAISHRFYGWLAYTLSWSDRLIGGGRAKSPSDWDQRHVVNLVAAYRFHGGYTLGSRFHLNTGRPYPIYDVDNGGPPEYVRLPTFYQLDVRAEKRFVFDKYVLDLYLEAINATATSELFDIRRDHGMLMKRAYRIVLPSIGIHVEW
jgi:hypothetical protein